MSGILKKSYGALLLFLFLFPQIQKGLHDFEHRHDSHCDATTEQHLHQLEHLCQLCDFSLVVSTENSFVSDDIILSSTLFQFSDECDKSIPVNFWQPLPPRAPPVFVG